MSKEDTTNRRQLHVYIVTHINCFLLFEKW